MASSASYRDSRLKQIGTLEGLITAQHVTIPVLIEQFKLAALSLNSREADRLRDELVTLQGEMIDNIYAMIVLKKEAGLI